MRKLIERLQGPNSGPIVLALGGTGAVLLLIAIIGAFTVGGGHKKVEAGASSGDTTTTVPGSVGTVDTGSTVPGATASTLANGQPAPAGGTSGGTGTGGTATTAKAGTTTAAGDTTGVSATAIKWGLHAPKTIDGAPLNLAADPLEGVDIYSAALGDFSGRKIDYRFADDRYTVDGGKAAATDLIDTQKVFFAEGTLGVDQIAQVAAEAKKRGTPYMAAGGSEKQFKDIGMFQIAGSYDSHLVALAKHLANETAKQPCAPAAASGDCAAGTSPYGGKTKIGVSVLNSPYINGPGAAIDVFKGALTSASNGRLSVVKVVTIEKPTDQTSYGPQITDLKSANVEILVPAQDPISTSRMVSECRTQNCTWNYAMSDFANDSDVGITLMAGNGTNPWVGMHNLSGGCYYLPDSAGHNPYDTSKCGNLKIAHDLWVAAKGESDWVSHGQGGASGYQVTHFWLGALKSLGSNVTRERFVAALRAYNGYSDLVTAPLTFQGSANIAHGLDRFAIYQGTTTPSGSHPYSWKQISDGIVGSF